MPRIKPGAAAWEASMLPLCEWLASIVKKFSPVRIQTQMGQTTPISTADLSATLPRAGTPMCYGWLSTKPEFGAFLKKVSKISFSWNWYRNIFFSAINLIFESEKKIHRFFFRPKNSGMQFSSEKHKWWGLSCPFNAGTHTHEHPNS